MFRHCKAASIVLLLGTILFGFVYPFGIWVAGQLFFSYQAEGSPLYIDGTIRGLHNIGQTFSSPSYFWGRPSMRPVFENGVIASGASNLPWSSLKLRSIVRARLGAFSKSLDYQGKTVPNDLVMASASGLDPDISFQAAIFQIPRVAKVRGIPENDLRVLVCHLEEPTLLGLFPRRINVLKLNMELNRLYGPPQAPVSTVERVALYTKTG